VLLGRLRRKQLPIRARVVWHERGALHGTVRWKMVRSIRNYASADTGPCCWQVLLGKLRRKQLPIPSCVVWHQYGALHWSVRGTMVRGIRDYASSNTAPDSNHTSANTHSSHASANTHSSHSNTCAHASTQSRHVSTNT
jgi:hypothetical protein